MTYYKQKDLDANTLQANKLNAQMQQSLYDSKQSLSNNIFAAQQSIPNVADGMSDTAISVADSMKGTRMANGTYGQGLQTFLRAFAGGARMAANQQRSNNAKAFEKKETDFHNKHKEVINYLQAANQAVVNTNNQITQQQKKIMTIQQSFLENYMRRVEQYGSGLEEWNNDSRNDFINSQLAVLNKAYPGSDFSYIGLNGNDIVIKEGSTNQLYNFNPETALKMMGYNQNPDFAKYETANRRIDATENRNDILENRAETYNKSVDNKANPELQYRLSSSKEQGKIDQGMVKDLRTKINYLNQFEDTLDALVDNAKKYYNTGKHGDFLKHGASWIAGGKGKPYSFKEQAGRALMGEEASSYIDTELNLLDTGVFAAQQALGGNNMASMVGVEYGTFPDMKKTNLKGYMRQVNALRAKISKQKSRFYEEINLAPNYNPINTANSNDNQEEQGGQQSSQASVFTYKGVSISDNKDDTFTFSFPNGKSKTVDSKSKDAVMSVL